MSEITPLPSLDPTSPTFRADVDDYFLNRVPTFGAQVEAARLEVESNTSTASGAAGTATAQAGVATGAAGTATEQADIATEGGNTATIQAALAAAKAADAVAAAGVDMSGISESIHSGAVVKAIIYDTGKDSDGGAWRKRCADKSWYTETIYGTWGGQAANVAAGWAACGSVAGGYFRNTTDGKYYTPTSVSTQTEVFRGNTREFPEQVAIIAEANRMVIYDLTQAGCPMWMVFVATGTSSYLSTGVLTAIAATNGQLFISSSGNGVFAINLLTETSTQRYASGSFIWLDPVAKRHAATRLTGSASAIVSSTGNDVALTVLDNAPIDPATGLPVPTISLATAGGVSVIKDDGTVVNSGATDPMVSVQFYGATLTYTHSAGTDTRRAKLPLSAGFTTFASYNHTSASIPAVLPGVSGKLAGNKLASGCSTGLAQLNENPATPVKGMVGYITNAYNSGWMPGDIRGAYLANTTAETITASGELVTNGTFATDTSGWADQTSTDATPSWVSGKLRLTRDTANTPAGMYQGMPTAIGRTYTIAADIVSTCFTFIRASTTSGNAGDLASSGSLVAGTSSTVLSFVAQGTTSYISVWAYTGAIGTTADFDNISTKLAEPDRSVKTQGLIVNGTLTKTAVATGANLVAYSGFSAANYLAQPYNSDLDFGTGDFCITGWVKNTATASQYLVARSSGGAGVRFQVLLSGGTGYASFYTNDGTTANSCSNAVSLTDSTWHLITAVKTGGVKTLYVDGVLAATQTPATNNTLANATATLAVGCETDLSSAAASCSLALWRIGATAPSADQIAHIYRTELPLFQPNAKCLIDGTSTAVTALAYDDVADTLHVGTSWGRSSFRDLLRVDSMATTVGATTSLAGNQGAILTGGASSGYFYQPALLLRDELRRKDEARKALGKVPVFFDFTATASQTAFAVPKGYTAKALYHNGTLKRETTTGVYWTRSSDGFAETCTLSTGATVSDWISIMCVRA